MRRLLSFVIGGTLLIVTQLASASFPTEPDEQATPGTVCRTGNTRRYPEHIVYCNRSVSSGKKRQVIALYEQQLGYEIYREGRNNFKIDHTIPLCAGGSNEISNLWPQHKSVYAITDPLEEPLCNKMAQGKLLQVDAIRLILEAKRNLDRAPEILQYIQSL